MILNLLILYHIHTSVLLTTIFYPVLTIQIYFYSCINNTGGGVRKVLFFTFFVVSFFLINSAQATWWDSNWNRCRDLTISNVFTANSPVYVNISGLTFTDASKEIRIVNTSCNNGGNAVKHRIIEDSGNIGDGYEWVRIMFPASSNTTYSVYYDNPSATYDPSLELKAGDIWDAYFNGTFTRPQDSPDWSDYMNTNCGCDYQLVNIDGQTRFKFTTWGTAQRGWKSPIHAKTTEWCMNTPTNANSLDGRLQIETRASYNEIIRINKTNMKFFRADTIINQGSEDWAIYRFLIWPDATYKLYKNNELVHTGSSSLYNPGFFDWGDPLPDDVGTTESYWTYLTITDDGEFPPSTVSIGSEEIHLPPTTTSTTTTIPYNYTELEERVEELENRTSALESMMTTVQDNIATIQTSIGVIQGQITDIFNEITSIWTEIDNIWNVVNATTTTTTTTTIPECIRNGKLCNCNGRCDGQETNETCPWDCL